MDVNIPPAYCFQNDGFGGSIPASPIKLLAVGGYIADSPGAKLAILLDGTQYGGGLLPSSV